MNVKRVLVATMIGGAVLTTGLAAGFGATPSTTYQPTTLNAPDPQVKSRWAERTAAAGDLNGDKTPDFFVGDPMQDVNGIVDAGRVYAVSGKTRTVLYAVDSPSPQTNAKFGFFISVIGDLNGDGKADVAVGTDAQDVYAGSGAPCGVPEPNGCYEDQGQAWVFGGADGKLLYTLNNPFPQGSAKNSARFGSRIGRAGDLNGDGKPEIIVGASNNDVPAGCGDASPLPVGCRVNQGQAFIFSGGSGALIEALDLPTGDQQPPGTCASSCGSFGIAVQGPGDTDGDKIADQLVDAGSYSFYTGSGTPCGTPEPNGCNEGQGREYLFSGRDGHLLLRIDDPEPQAGATFGFQDATPLSPGDVNKDGYADLYANGFVQNGPAGEGQGRAWVFNGKTGALLYRIDDPTPEVGGQFGWSLSGTDYNKDGVPDLYIGQSPHHVAGATGSGGTYVFNGKDGSLLKPLELPATDVQPSLAGDLGPNLGWTAAAPGDLNGDGQPDFIAGAPFENINSSQDQGQLYVFLSSDKTAPGQPKVTGPRHPSAKQRLTYVFSASDPDNTASELHFRCALRPGPLRPCGTQVRAKLARGTHLLRVQAFDVAGNAGPIAQVKIVVTR